MRIQHNISAMNSYRNFSSNTSKLNKNLEKLSTGYKINRAGDDAAGLAISEKMRAQISGIEGATKNAKDGISLIQTAEGALTEVHDMLNRMTTLAEQSANGTYDDEVDRNQLQKEITALKDEIDRIADSTNYNGLKLLDGSLGGSTENKVAEVSGARLQNHVIDATKATTTATLGAVTLAAASGTTTPANEGAKFTLNVGLSDGRSVAVDLTVQKEGTNYNLVGSDGKVYGAMDGTTASKARDALRNAFSKAAKDTELGDIFDITASTTAGDGKIVFTAKEAGKDGLTVTSADVKVDLTNAADTTKSVKSIAASDVAATEGTDKSQGFDASKLMSYNAKANGGKGNANKAVFEVNGVKFAIGSFDQDLTNLGDDVNYISLKQSTSTGGFKMASVSTGGTEDSDGFAINAEGAKMIAHEISQKAGVSVEFKSLASNTAIDDTDKVAAGGMKVFKVGDVIGTEGKGLTLQIGDTSDSYNKMTVNVSDMHAEAIGLGDLDISSQEGASKALDQIKNAVNMVSDVRGSLGALQNRLDHTINNLGVMRENIQNAESLIRDTDVAEEMMAYTKNNILNQSAQAMLAQANQLPQGVLQLLG